MIRFVVLLVFIFPLTAAAQFSYIADQTVPVLDGNGDTLPLSWTGGLNAAQYNTMDLNGDGNDDLVLFDRIANKVITFLNQNSQYVYSKDYEKFFPPEITNWILLRDFNCDGKKDLFTSDLFGIKVFLNTTSDVTPEWEHFFFYGASSKSPVILTKGFSSKVNLQIQYDDLPSITDMDGDGDLDILNLRFPNGGTVEFHKNFSKERYGTCDSLDFERITQSWGNFTECSCGDFALNNAECPIGGRLKHAGGKTLLAMDVDGDNDQDLLFSEASCTQLYLLRNTGDSQTANITSTSTFPPGNPVNFRLFPAAFYEDVDFDGVKDLLSTPNVYFNNFPADNPNLQNSNWFYKNTGTNAQPSFSLSKTNFLQDQMIDVGENSLPAFADYDADGDLDMFISQFTTQSYIASIHLYKNIGTESEPEFKLETNDFLGFSNFILFNVKLQWVDITGDGKIDMVFTSTSFQTGATSLNYIANKSSGAFDFGNMETIATNFTIARSENIYVTDVNLDGIQDLLVGKSNGALQYWKNNGPKGTFNYSLEDDSFLGLGVSVLRQNPRCATSDLDADGREDLVLGDQTGSLKIINNYREATDVSGAITDIIYYELQQAYSFHDFGGYVYPEIANIFKTNKPAIIVGNSLGGVQLLRHDNGESLPDEPVVTIYPIPVVRSETIHIRVDRPALMEIYSPLGQRLSDNITFNANIIYDLSFPFLSSGVYILRFVSNNKSTIKRIVIY